MIRRGQYDPTADRSLAASNAGAFGVRVDAAPAIWDFALTDEPPMPDRATLRAELDAAIARLVARAAAERWPIRADHCFLRIAYDNAVAAKWDVAHGRPAWRSLPLESLAAALAIARRIEANGESALRELNAVSLGFRRRSSFRSSQAPYASDRIGRLRPR